MLCTILTPLASLGSVSVAGGSKNCALGQKSWKFRQMEGYQRNYASCWGKLFGGRSGRIWLVLCFSGFQDFLLPIDKSLKRVFLQETLGKCRSYAASKTRSHMKLPDGHQWCLCSKLLTCSSLLHLKKRSFWVRLCLRKKGLFNKNNSQWIWPK